MGKFTALEKAQLTKNWSLEEQSALAHFLKELRVEEKETVFLGKSGERMLYFIESGAVRLAFEGTEVDLHEGDSFAEMSIVHATHKIVSAFALKDCVFWVLPFQKWEDMKRAAPMISLKLIESICQKMAQLLNNNFQPHQALAEKSQSASSNRPPSSFEFQ
ncbi:MAG: hypothetical protein JWQ35_2384 [Bacteriovoracaceae bacterium]|nr:hypothetical protein [Bacteriovoracaceae bacterium]